MTYPCGCYYQGKSRRFNGILYWIYWCHCRQVQVTQKVYEGGGHDLERV